MSLGHFANSEFLTLGVELELQIVSHTDGDLAHASAELLRLVQGHKIPGAIVPEMTDSMIELSTGICRDHADVLAQLKQTREVLLEAADTLDVGLCGGGTHPFQHWHQRRIFDKPRFHELSSLYGYLSKQFTIFGQHIHIGCTDANQALTLLHRMSRFIPHFIALSASSPFVQGQDTGFDSSRLNSVFAFPLSGRAPFVRSWVEFEDYFGRMTRTGVVRSMKDFYWDIRPKPEYGTIEIRVLDTPLTIGRAAALAAFAQALARHLMVDRPFEPAEDDYLVYTFNRFQACRFGLEATWVDPGTGEHRVLRDHLMEVLQRLEPHAAVLGAEAGLAALRLDLQGHGNDATWLRTRYAALGDLASVVARQVQAWAD
jgi:carboxylate-amine ligase